MNTNPNVKRILCYGDSNTWGREDAEKHTPNVRWTGVLQDLLGDDFEVIEEGLPSRTTNIDDPEKPDRNGLTYFRPCIESLQPIDICIIWLGTNDFKERLGRTVVDIAEGVREVVQFAKKYVDPKHILLVSPPAMYDTEASKAYGFVNVHEKTLKLGAEYEKVAQEEGTAFVDLHESGITPREDEGVHLSPEMHKKIAEVFEGKVGEMRG